MSAGATREVGQTFIVGLTGACQGALARVAMSHVRSGKRSRECKGLLVGAALSRRTAF